MAELPQPVVGPPGLQAEVLPNGKHLPPASTRFKPGVSGNPDGIPKGTKQVKRRLRSALIRRLKAHPEKINEIVEGLIGGCAEGDGACQRIAWDRLDGVLEKQVKVTGTAVVKVIVRGGPAPESP